MHQSDSEIRRQYHYIGGACPLQNIVQGCSGWGIAMGIPMDMGKTHGMGIVINLMGLWNYYR